MGLGLARSAAELAICAGSHGLGGTLRFTALHSEAGGHPSPGTENAVEQCGQPQIGVKLREMQTEARRADLDNVEISPLGRLQSLSVTPWKGEFYACVQRDDQSIVILIVPGSHRCRLGSPAPLAANDRLVKMGPWMCSHA